ncbi:MAG: beta-propeller domain-containing protein [Clostridia bacterium]|nr:beta-propeller domain-containing protein [Clostridia bacterium]
MFEKRYKNSLENISADKYIKSKVLSKIESETEKQNKPIKPIYKTAIAFALCFVLIFTSVATISGINLIKNNFKKSEVNTELKKQTNSYDDVYGALKKFKKSDLINGIFPRKESDMELYAIEDYAADDGAANAGGTNKGNNTSASATDTTANDDYTNTNNQVSGVEESDIVKTDGKYIYTLSARNKEFRIVDAKSLKLLSNDFLLNDIIGLTNEMYLYDNYVVFLSNGQFGSRMTKAVVLDISNREKPKRVYDLEQSGIYVSSRLIGNKLYLITNYNLDVFNIAKNDTSTYIPTVNCENFAGQVKSDTINICPNPNSAEYTVVCGYNITNGKLTDTKSLLGNSQNVYCSTKNIITAGYNWEEEKTTVVRYAISDGKIDLKANGSIDGDLLNQFSIDENDGYFRFVTTVDKQVKSYNDFGVGKEIVSVTTNRSNSLVILDKNLEKVGEVKDLAPDERVYSVRFMGDYAYFVTFRQTDPLFCVELKDPKNPKVLSALKIPGFSNFLFPFGEGKLLGIGMDADEITGRARNVKISMFDISNPADVKEASKFVTKYYYSDATNSHKASLVDVKRNLIGFSAENGNSGEYVIFKYENGSFKNVFSVNLESIDNAYSVRGICIGNNLYIITEDFISAYDLDGFKLINKLYF